MESLPRSTLTFSEVYYIPYAALAYVSLLVINALALLGFAIHRHKASQGTDHVCLPLYL
jgi:hypothetical protein